MLNHGDFHKCSRQKFLLFSIFKNSENNIIVNIKYAIEQENYDPSLKNKITSIWGTLKCLCL